MTATPTTPTAMMFPSTPEEYEEYVEVLNTPIRPRTNEGVSFTLYGEKRTGSVSSLDTADGHFVIITRCPYTGDTEWIASNKVEDLKVGW